MCNPILTVDLVYESLHICVSTHLYMYIVHLYKKMAAHGFAIAINNGGFSATITLHER